MQFWMHLKLRNNSNSVVKGPAIVESRTTTIVVPPEKLAKVDAFLDIMLEP